MFNVSLNKNPLTQQQRSAGEVPGLGCPLQRAADEGDAANVVRHVRQRGRPGHERLEGRALEAGGGGRAGKEMGGRPDG